MKTCSKCKEEKPFSSYYKRENGYRAECKECFSLKRKSHYENNKLKVSVQNKAYRVANREKLLESKRGYRENNRVKILESAKLYREKRKVEVDVDVRRRYHREYQKQRSAVDPVFKLAGNIRHNVYMSFKRGTGNNWSKPTNTEQILGVKMKDFIEHIETLLKPGMTLANHGEWHLDHVIPLERAKTERDVVMLCHYTNYQPLWAEDNLSKSCR